MEALRLIACGVLVARLKELVGVGGATGMPAACVICAGGSPAGKTVEGICNMLPIGGNPGTTPGSPYTKPGLLKTD